MSLLRVSMSLSGYKHSRTTQLDPGSVPFSSPALKTSFRTYSDPRPTNARANLHIKLWRLYLSKIQTVVLMGWTLTILIVASYVLMWDKKGLLTLAPYKLNVANVRTSNTTVSVQTTSVDMKQLVGMIQSKLKYTSRRLPDKKDIIRTDPRLFSVIPRNFLPGIKNPCWYEEFSGETSDDLYKSNRFAMYSRTFSSVCEKLRSNFSQHLRQQDGQLFRLRCLPYFFIIGQPKCGTTDLFYRLLLHPELKFNVMKEPHWWTRKRFGYIEYLMDFHKSFPVEDYVDLFDSAAHNIQASSNGEHPPLQLLSGDASVSTMWDNQAWSYIHGAGEGTDPPFLVQDFIHTVQPGAKIIIMLRDPAERLYSDYLFFGTANKSTEDFHQKVLESVQLFHACLLGRSLRSCVYSTGLSKSMRVRLNLGLYIIFLLDWLTVFPREQIFVIRLEDYAANLRGTLESVLSFLNTSSLPQKAVAELTKTGPFNARQRAHRDLGPMLLSTKKLLSEFYRPFNHKLAAVLDDAAFLWSDKDFLHA